MALIGMRYCAACEVDYDSGVPVFSGGRLIGKGISVNKDVSFTTAELYADNELAESDESFESGTLTINTADYGMKEADILPIQAFLYGHEYIEATDTAPATIRKSADDVKPFRGFAYIKTRKMNNKVSYEVTVLYKCKFTAAAEDAATKEQGTTYNTPTINGVFYTCQVNADESKAKATYEDISYFDSYAKAVDYIHTLFKMS